MKKILMFLVVLVVAFGLVATSHALKLTIDDGVGGLDALTFNTTDTGLVSYVGAYGDFSFVMAAGLSYPDYDGQANLPKLHLNGLVSGVGDISFTLSDTYDALNPDAHFRTGFSTTNYNGETSFVSRIDGVTLSDIGLSGSDGVTMFTSILPLDPTSFELSLEVLIHHDSIGFSSFDAEVSAVPEPGTLLLLGSGLIGIATYARRRKK